MKIVQKKVTNANTCKLKVKEQGGIRKLGIQAPQGFQIKLNNDQNVIEMGHFGVYELDLISIGYGVTVVEVSAPKESESATIIIDAVIEGELDEEAQV